MLSVLLNAWIWSKSGHLFDNRPVQEAKTAQQEELLLLRLAPPPELNDDPKKLINTLDRSEVQPEKTNRISEFDSKAADEQPSEIQDGNPTGEPDEEMEVMPDTVNPVPPTPPQIEVEPSPKVIPIEEVAAEKDTELAPEKTEEDQPPEPITEEKETTEGFGKEKELLEQLEKILEEPPAPDVKELKKEMERMEVAKSEEVPQVLPSVPEIPVEGEKNSPTISSGKGAEVKGFSNFDANAHEMAPYMKEIQKRVRRQWLAGVQMRYPGSTRAKARVKCSIRPNGTLEFVTVVDKGNSVTFSLICQDAIQKAAPFPEFPFDVPAIYRNENLEITWTFSYL
jgi:hypothetical protein